MSLCFLQVQLNQTVTTTFSELFIPARSLVYGTYQLQLTVAMTAVPNLTSSASIYITIIPTNIQPNLLLFGTSMIRLGHEQNLTLNPGKFSLDPDTTTFNASVSRNILYYYLLCTFINRIGSTLTIVEFMVSTISHPSMEHNYRSMILGLIH